MRTSTTGQDGQPIDEWWSVVIVGQTFPIAGRGLGYQRHAGQVTAFQTPRGELDRYDKLYRVMATSIRLEPQFQAWTTTPGPTATTSTS